MTVNRTTLLDLPLPVTGTESGTWGDTTNNGLTQYLDIAIAGTLVLSTDADVTLTSTEGDSSATNIGATTAQYAILRWTATGSTTRNITALAQSKTYVVINATGGTQSIVLRGAGPTTGVTIISGEKAFCVWNGSDFVKVSSSAAAGGSNTQVQYNSSGVLAGSSNMTFDGTSLTLGGNPTLSAGTANGVLYLNGSKVATSGSALTFDGTNLGVGIATGLAKLHLYGSGQIGIVESSGNYTTTGSGYLRWKDVNGNAAFVGYGGNANNFDIFNALNGAITFNTNSTEGMRLTSTGLGIGTSSPGTKLDVSGTIRSIGSTGASSPRINLLSTGFWTWGIYGDGNTLKFQNDTNDRLTLDSSGNLGLGVTPSAWSGSFKALQIGAGLSLYDNGIGSGTFLGANYFYNGTNNIYINSTFATAYGQSAGVHAWYTAPSGTAGNAITFTQAMTLDASGNLLVGTTSGSGDRIYASGYIRASSGFKTDGTTWIDSPASETMRFVTNNTERARITSGGDLLVGATSQRFTEQFRVVGATVGAVIESASGYVTQYLRNDGPSGTRKFVSLLNSSSTECGSITYDGSTVAYNTTSDYRLKENIQPMSGALAKIATLKPCTYKWKADGSDGEGFIAHELAEVVPQCVTGEKDAVDAKGNPQYQGIDTSFLIATLTAAIQEQQALITSLTARVALLEGN